MVDPPQIIDRCRACGGGGPGRYAHIIMVREDTLSDDTGPALTDEIVFYCMACVEEMEQEAAFERELMKDPEYRKEAERQREEHTRQFRAALARAVKIN